MVSQWWSPPQLLIMSNTATGIIGVAGSNIVAVASICIVLGFYPTGYGGDWWWYHQDRVLKLSQWWSPPQLLIMSNTATWIIGVSGSDINSRSCSFHLHCARILPHKIRWWLVVVPSGSRLEFIHFWCHFTPLLNSSDRIVPQSFSREFFPYSIIPAHLTQ